MARVESSPSGLRCGHSEYTSEDVPGLAAQGCTMIETLEIARDIAEKLLEAQNERGNPIDLTGGNHG
ncbi:MAG: type II toxin-antitoxin system HicB family antitoxin [Chloroflexi bacterium]|nr:type II toxin-antitoxin system HicB family antitoxin [Chloroflexota bacterium]